MFIGLGLTVCGQYGGTPSPSPTPTGTLDPAITAPVLTLATAYNTYPLTVDAAFDDTVSVGDKIEAQYSTDPRFATYTALALHTITSGEASANAANLGFSAILSGTNYIRERVVQAGTGNYSAWSNTLLQGALADTTPTAFSFTDVTGQTVSSDTTSSEITLTGFNSPITGDAGGALYAVDEGSGYGSFISTLGRTFYPGDKVKLKVTNSGSGGVATTATFTAGGVSDTFSSTTASSYETEADALFNRWATAGAAASDPDKVIANNLFVALKSGAVSGSNILAKCDLLHISALHSDLVDHINWAQDAYHCTETNTGAKTFTAYEGIDNTGSYRQDTGFNPTTAVSPKSSLNSVAIFVYSRQDVTDSTNWDYGNANLQIDSRHATSTTVRATLNSGSIWFSATADSLGFHAATRTASNAIMFFKNGVSLGTATTASTSQTNANILIHGTVSGGSTRQIGASGLFSGLTLNELTDLRNAIEAYFDAHGKGVA